MAITITRRLAIINGFVEIPDGQRRFRTSLTAADVLSLIPGSTLEREGTMVGDQEFILLPAESRQAGPQLDYFQILRVAAEAVMT